MTNLVLWKKEMVAHRDEHAIRDPSLIKDQYAGEGIRKLHSEILQLHNQRFLLTTSAVIFYGSVAGWITTTLLRPEILMREQHISVNPPQVQYLLPFMTALVWMVLYALFRYQVSLAFTVRWLATYHMYKASDWEWTWHFFRWLQKTSESKKMKSGEEPFSAYGVNTHVFQWLVIITYAYFFFLHTLIFGIPNLSQLDEYFRTQISEMITPWFWWIVLLFALLWLLRHMQQKDYKANNPDEQNLLERWREAAEAAKCEDNTSRYVATTEIQLGSQPAGMFVIAPGVCFSLPEIEQHLVNQGLLVDANKAPNNTA